MYLKSVSSRAAQDVRARLTQLQEPRTKYMQLRILNIQVGVSFPAMWNPEDKTLTNTPPATKRRSAKCRISLVLVFEVVFVVIVVRAKCLGVASTPTGSSY